MKITHKNLLVLGALLGYKGFEEGLCAGFSGMWMQAVLAKDEESFYRRLNLIAEYKEDFQKLNQEISKTKQKVKEYLLITEKERDLLSILSFYDGISLYLTPTENQGVFNDTFIPQDDIKAIFSKTKPTSLEQEDLSIVLEKTYSCDKSTLHHYMVELKEVLIHSELEFPITLNSYNHSVCLKYDLQKEGWIYLDTNNLHDRKLSTSELVNCIFTSFQSLSHVVFNQKIYAYSLEDQIIEKFQEINLKFPIKKHFRLIRDQFGSTPLYIACKNGQSEVAEELLQHGASANQPLINGFAPLHAVCFNGNLELVKKLLQYGANVNLAFTNSSSPLYIACQEGHLGVANVLLKFDADVNKGRIMTNSSPLFIACQNGHIEVTKLLLQRGADINLANNTGATPLYIVCNNGDVKMLRELLQHGVNVNQAKKNGISPLYIACQKGRLEVVKELLQHGADINQANINNDTPLFIACQQNQIAVVKELLKLGANINQANANGDSPLYIACHKGHTEIVNELLQYGANINQVNINTISPLSIAFKNAHFKIVKKLLQHRAVTHQINTNDASPLECQNRHTKEADINPVNVNVTRPNLQNIDEIPLLQDSSLRNVFFKKSHLFSLEKKPLLTPN